MILTCIILAVLALIGLTLDGRTFAFSKGRTALLKALMPFLIITGHISIYNPGKMDDFSWLGTFVVGLFFFVTGYGLEHKRLKGKISMTQLARRIGKLFTPLLIPIAIFLIIMAAFGDDVPAFVKEHLHIYELILPYTWFFVVNAVFCILFYIISDHIKGNRRFNSVMVCAVVIFSVANFFIFRDYAYTNFSNLTFPAGLLYKQHEKRIIKILSHNLVVIGLIAIFTLLNMFIYHTPHYAIPLAVLLWTVLFMSLFARIPTRQNRVIGYLSSISYEVYVCQGISYYLIAKSTLSLPFGIYIVVSVFLTIVIAGLCHLITKRAVKPFILKAINR